MTNLINFGAYGVPLSGTNLCGYNPETSDEELCAKYFQLSVISPLAVMNTIGDSFDFMPFNFSAKARSSVIASLQQRLGLIAYMRSQLNQISMNGGALIAPLFTQRGFTEDIQKVQDLSGVMFGSALRAVFSFK
jgi:lysosomal alpha-glucosidase